MAIRAEDLGGRKAKRKVYSSRGKLCSLKRRIYTRYSSLTLLPVLFVFSLICTVSPVAKVLAADENCIDNASGSTVPTGQGDSEKAKIAGNASEKLQKAKELIAQGRFEEGISLAEEAVKLDPGNAEADESAQMWKKDLSEITSHISRARSLIDFDEFQEAKTEIETAKKRNPNYQALLEVERLLNDKKEAEREKRLKEIREKTRQWRALDKERRNLEGMEKSRGRPNLQPAPALKKQTAVPKTTLKESEETGSNPAGEPLWRAPYKERRNLLEGMGESHERQNLQPAPALEKQTAVPKTALKESEETGSNPAGEPLPIPSLGRIWRVKELWRGRVSFEGTWTQRGDSEVFDAEWRHLPDGQTIRDTLRNIRIEGDQINIHRDGTNGEYKGRLSLDGRHIEGTATWYSPFWSWTAEVEP
jgi:tetratricopeptide (TPR) repeat protein